MSRYHVLTGCLPHWLVPTQAIETALANKLEQRRIKREQQSKSAAKEIEEFTGEFLSAARRCFTLIDKDGGGTLSKEEIVLSPRGSPADGTRRRRDVDVPRDESGRRAAVATWIFRETSRPWLRRLFGRDRRVSLRFARSKTSQR